ncbi:MAG: hypothetical protein V3T70_08290 [Phycisphaerae bacterium]
MFLAVMGTAIVVWTVALTAMTSAHIRLRGANESMDVSEAQVLARSAVHHAVLTLNAATQGGVQTWRTTFSNRVVSVSKTFGRGTISWALVDEADANLANDPSQLVRVYGIGRVGEAVQVYSVSVQPKTTTLDVLRTTAHSAGDFNADNKLFANGGPLSTNAVFDNAANITGDVEAVSYTLNGGSITGTVTLTQAKELPSSSVFDSIYAPMATPIDWASLPVQAGNNVLSGIWSASSNPQGGPLNPAGIYHIQVPNSGGLKLQSFELTGTLLITAGLSADIIAGASIAWQPHQPGLPLMLVKGPDVDVTFSGPTGAAHQGLIHVIGAASKTILGARFNLTGTVVCEGRLQAGHAQDTTITHDPSLYSNPPPGYTSIKMAPVRGTWRRDVVP